MKYNNPTPVVVSLLPVDNKLLAIRRGIEPCVGRLVFPGGYIDQGETWQEASVRELFEETGIELQATQSQLFSVESALQSNHLLLFVVFPKMQKDQVDFSFSCQEAQGVALVDKAHKLAFPLHQKIKDQYFTD